MPHALLSVDVLHTASFAYSHTLQYFSLPCFAAAFGGQFLAL